jgi:ABC-type dipeptide/oligopeptide/nickel transport system permease subunit
MTEHVGGRREERALAEAGANIMPGAAAVVPGGGAGDDFTLTYEHGVEVKARSQWAYARIRFFRHRLALFSLVVLILVGIVAVFPAWFAPYGPNEQNLPGIDAAGNLTTGEIAQAPSWDHLFGTDLLGRDYLSRVIFGLQTSLWVAMFVAILSTLIGTATGAFAGYYGGVLDNLLMRVTDLVLTLPTLAVLLAAAAFFGQEGQKIGPITLSQPAMIGLILALLFWTGLARIIRGVFLSLREKEFVEAAKASGASDSRIILRHILPNCIGPIVVTMTLIVAAAILTEAALSFLGFGIQPPEPALGNLIAEGNVGGLGYWWLVTFPGIVIVIIALSVNFIGDGLRDALDPTQRIRA